MSPHLPVFWLTGPPAAGKSIVAWALYRRLAAGGVPVAYVDIDQLGMLYPDVMSDPQGHRTKATLLAALLPGYAAAGAQVVIVSGVADPVTGPDLPDVDLTTCLLVPSDAELRDRLVARGWDADDLTEALAERVAVTASVLPGPRFDVEGLTVVGADLGVRSAVVATALAQQRAMEAAGDHGHVLDVSGLAPAEALDRLGTLLQRSSQQS